MASNGYTRDLEFIILMLAKSSCSSSVSSKCLSLW